MHVAQSVRCALLPLIGAIVCASACAPGATAPSTAGRGAQPSSGSAEPGQMKTLVMGMGAILDGFSIASTSNTGGGRLGFIEIHSQALFTADKTSGRPIPRLLAEQPTQDNGGLRLTDDGGLLATYKLRPNVKWADGAPFTARDLMFSFRIAKSGILQMIDSGPSKLMES